MSTSQRQLSYICFHHRLQLELKGSEPLLEVQGNTGLRSQSKSSKKSKKMHINFILKNVRKIPLLSCLTIRQHFIVSVDCLS